MRKVCCIASLFLVLAGHVLAQPANNIAVVEIYYPAGRTPLGIPTMVAADFRNTGTNDQTNVRVIATITRNNTTVYRDTQYINDWLSGEYRDTSFRDFTPTQKGDYTVCFIAELTSDEVASDNSMCRMLSTRYEADLKAIAVTYPEDGNEFRAQTEIRIRGRFTNQGVRDLFDVRARVQVRTCVGKLLKFQVDSLIPEIYFDSTVEFRFPSKNSSMDICNLEPGCYEVAVIALLSDDVDRTNDTARSSFTITPLDNNIRTDAFIYPKNGDAFIVDSTVSTTIRFKNTGLNTQNNVGLVVQVKDPTGSVILHDLKYETNWKKDETRTVTFKSFKCLLIGQYTITTFPLLSGDEARRDDTLSVKISADVKINIKIVSILDPVSDDRKQMGVRFTPKVLIKLEAKFPKQATNVPVTISIGECWREGPSMDTIIPYLSTDAETVFTFSTSIRSWDMSELAIGCYRLRVILPYGGEFSYDDTLEHIFKVVDSSVRKNIVAAEILEPPKSYMTSDMTKSVPLKAVFINRGADDQTDLKVASYIRYKLDSIVYRDTETIASIKSMDSAVVSFGNFKPLSETDRGLYWHYGYSMLPFDQYPKNDTTYSNFGYGELEDIRAVRVAKPAMNEIIKEKTPFLPTGVFEWVGLLGEWPFSPIPINFEIRRCDDDEIVYYAESVIESIAWYQGEVPFIFPTANDDWSVLDLTPGCYKAKIAAVFFDFAVSDDNTAESEFTISPGSAVDGKSQNVFQLLHVYPNPATSSTILTYDLPDNGNVTIKLYDPTGRTIHQIISNQVRSFGRHSVSISTLGLVEGIYFCELTFYGSGGIVHRQTKAISVIH